MATTQKLQKLTTKQEVRLCQVRTVQDLSQSLKPHIQVGPTSKNKDLSSTAYCNARTSTWRHQTTSV